MTECPLLQLLFSANKCPRMHITMFQLYIPLSKASRSVEKRALAQRGGGYVNVRECACPNLEQRRQTCGDAILNPAADAVKTCQDLPSFDCGTATLEPCPTILTLNERAVLQHHGHDTSAQPDRTAEQRKRN